MVSLSLVWRSVVGAATLLEPRPDHVDRCDDAAEQDSEQNVYEEEVERVSPGDHVVERPDDERNGRIDEPVDKELFHGHLPK